MSAPREPSREPSRNAPRSAGLAAPLAVGAGLAAALLLLAGAALSQALRDDSPPRLFVEAPERAPAGAPFSLRISADEPATFTVTYAGTEVVEVAQDLELALNAVEGPAGVTVRAEDAAGNAVDATLEVFGVPEPALRIEATPAAVAGGPVAVRAAWEDLGAGVESWELTLGEPGAGGRSLRVVPVAGPDGETTGLVGLGLVPFGRDDAAWTARLRVRDGYGREVTAEAPVEVRADGQPVEHLNLSAGTLSVITPEGRERENAALAAAYASSADAPLWNGPWLLPIEGRSTAGYGGPRTYAAGGPVSYHTGADLAAPTGTPIRAANDGTVLVADTYPIKGGLVVIDHGADVLSLYFHQSRILVEEGQAVARGDVIGEVGSTGLSTGPHLHWEMRVAGEPTDPMAWVGSVLPGIEGGLTGGE